MLTLPPRTDEAEDDFVAVWRDGDGTPEALVEAISAALDARRPQLAARLVGLVDFKVEGEEQALLERARAAAHMVLLRAATSSATADMHAAWSALRERLGTRARARVRERHRDSVDPAPRKRRRRGRRS